MRVKRPLGAAAIAVGVALLVAALMSGGSHGSSHRAAPGASAGDLGQSPGAVSDVGAGRPSAGTTATASSRESPEIAGLIARGEPIYCAGPRGDEIALTFDDGPGPYTRKAIRKLRKHGLRATFFIVGRNIALVPGVTREERALGAVGDHTFTHPLLTALAPAEAETQIASTQSLLERSSGGPVFLFRPPYGGRDAEIDAIARTHGLLEILWTVDSADSLGANYAQIAHNVIAGLRPGAIILMHENRGQTIRAMLGIFAAIQRKHLRAVSVPELLTDDPPSAAQLRAGGRGCGSLFVSAKGGS